MEEGEGKENWAVVRMGEDGIGKGGLDVLYSVRSYACRQGT